MFPHFSKLRNVTVPFTDWLDVNCLVTCTKFGASGEPDPKPNPELEGVGTRPGWPDSPIPSDRLENV